MLRRLSGRAAPSLPKNIGSVVIVGNLTLKDIAKIAGVSTATVSRVVNSEPGIRASTYQKIKSIIDQNNYMPNAAARNLKTNKTHLIGLLVSNISNPHFSELSQVVEEILWEKGYLLVVCSTQERADLELSYIRKLIGLRVDGLIINTTNQNCHFIASLRHNTPVILIERNIQDNDFIGDTVLSNNYHGVYMMVQYLIQRGHRKIGIINSSLQVSTGLERYNGFKAAMAEIGITVDERYPYRYDSQFFNEEDGIVGCKHLMGLCDRPTAIIISNNAMAIGAYKYLCINGFKVPGDVSIMSYGNIANSELYRVSPSYTTLSPYFVGEKAAELLLSRIERPCGNREVIFEPMLVNNDSVGSV